MYLGALDRLALSAEEAIAIEESPERHPCSAGRWTLLRGYASDVTRQLDLSEADIVVESLDDLPLSDVLQAATAAS